MEHIEPVSSALAGVRVSTGMLGRFMSVDVRRLVRWLGAGFWAVTDYGLFAFSNFILNVLLARWLAPADYGAFTVGFTIFLLLAAVQTGLFILPMQVFGADPTRRHPSEYLGAVLQGHLGFTLAAAVMCLFGGWAFWWTDSRVLYPTLFALGFAAPAILWLWLMRNTCYVYRQNPLAVAAGLLYLLVLVGQAYALHLWQRLSAASAMGVMGISSLAAALWLATLLKQRQPRPQFRMGAMLRETMGSHWRFGRWMVGQNLLVWFIMGIWYIVLPVWGGLAASGTFRALAVLTLPLVFALVGGQRALIAGLVRARGQTRFETLFRAVLVLSVSASVIYWVLLGVFGGFLLTRLYGQYGEHARILWILGAALPLEAVATAFRAVLLAQERPDLVFWSYVSAVIAMSVVGLPLALAAGYWGAGIGTLLATLMSAGAMWMCLKGVARSSRLQPASVRP